MGEYVYKMFRRRTRPDGTIFLTSLVVDVGQEYAPGIVNTPVLEGTKLLAFIDMDSLRNFEHISMEPVEVWRCLAEGVEDVHELCHIGKRVSTDMIKTWWDDGCIGFFIGIEPPPGTVGCDSIELVERLYADGPYMKLPSE